MLSINLYINKNIITIDDEIRVYCCGPTLTSRPHIGNFRSIIIINFLVGALKSMGIKINFITNITDIGYISHSDGTKTFLENEKIKHIQIIQDNWIYYSQDIDLLELDVGHVEAASCWLNECKKHILEAKNKGFVDYDKENTGLYAKIDSMNINRSELLDGGKRIQDFAVWRFDKELKKGEVFSGIPGWHIECFIMIKESFIKDSEGFLLDLHVGGRDLKDLHHNYEIIHHYMENENYKLSRSWMHCGHVLLNGEKMSKSTRNIMFLEDLINKGLYFFGIKLLFIKDVKVEINISDAVIIEMKKIQDNLIINWLKALVKLFKLHSFYDLEEQIKYLFSIAQESVNNKDQRACSVINYVLGNMSLNKIFLIIRQFSLVSQEDIIQFIWICRTLNLSFEKTIIEILSSTKKYLYLLKIRFRAKQSKKYKYADEIRELINNKAHVHDLSKEISICLKPSII